MSSEWGFFSGPIPALRFARLSNSKRRAASTRGYAALADTELIPTQRINEAYERILKGDVKGRFVIDMASLKREPITS
jgi:hypothetical protein